MASILETAKEAIKTAQKGIQLKDAAEIVRKAIQRKYSGQWVVRERPDVKNHFLVVDIRDGKGVDVGLSNYERNGFYVGVKTF